MQTSPRLWPLTRLPGWMHISPSRWMHQAQKASASGVSPGRRGAAGQAHHQHHCHLTNHHAQSARATPWPTLHPSSLAWWTASCAQSCTGSRPVRKLQETAIYSRPIAVHVMRCLRASTKPALCRGSWLPPQAPKRIRPTPTGAGPGMPLPLLPPLRTSPPPPSTGGQQPHTSKAARSPP